MESKADLFMAQMQDYLKIGAEGRMNRPSILSPDNWVWRMTKGADSDALAEHIRKLTKKANRI